jgi:tRNA nucleotidyltransferase (CCA-adding enzyme)
LYNPVFFSAIPQDISSEFSEPTFPLDRGLANSTVLDAILNRRLDSQIPIPHLIYLRHFQKDNSAKPRLYLATALTPYYGVTYADKKKKIHPGVEAVIRESLKLGVQQHYLDGIPVLFLAVDPVRQLCEEYASFPADRLRSSIGTILLPVAYRDPVLTTLV